MRTSTTLKNTFQLYIRLHFIIGSCKNRVAIELNVERNSFEWNYVSREKGNNDVKGGIRLAIITLLKGEQCKHVVRRTHFPRLNPTVPHILISDDEQKLFCNI